MFDGKDIVALAEERIGDRYVLGARVYIANRDWSGPWDCAEFVSWACYHAYKMVIAVQPPDVRVGESYSGWWYEDARKLGGMIDVGAAIGTPGAILIRKPGDQGIKIGHVAISRGNNTTIEARGALYGVQIVPDANTRKWSCGFLIPGVRYNGGSGPAAALPTNIIELTSPFTRGEAVVAIQKALLQQGVDPGALDGIFGPATAAAVAAFQAQEGLVVDSMVGPETRKHLGI